MGTAGKIYDILASNAGLRKHSSNLVASIWQKPPASHPTANKMNALTTLPIPLKSKTDLYEDVRLANPSKSGLGLKVTQAAAYGKAMFRFYKEGVRNVWTNKRQMSHLMKHEYNITNQVNNKGDTVDIKIPGFSKLVSELAQTLYMNKIANELLRNSTTADVVKSNNIETIYDENLINLPRSQFQLINRTVKDFPKLPAFAVIALIFAEMTPILCYAFPEITPLTCVLPSILPRMRDSKSGAIIHKLRADESKFEDWALETAYNIPYQVLLPLTGQLGLRSKYLPGSLYPESYLRNKLHRYYNYLMVDNYYLSGLNGNGNVWDLEDDELVQAGLERCLIPDVAAFVKTVPKHRSEELQKLRMKLLRSVVDMNTYGVGYLTVGHLIEPKNDS